MYFLYPIIALFCEAIAKTTDKLNYRRNHIRPRQIMFLVFVSMSVFVLIFIILSKKPLPTITLVSFGLILLIGLVSFLGNIFDYLSLKSDDLSLREPLLNFEPIVGGLFGYLFFPSERKIGFLVAFILGAVIVYWGSHQRRLGKIQASGMFYLVLAVIFEALLPSINKLELSHLSPTYITFFRVVIVLVLTSIFLPVKRFKSLTSNKIIYAALAGFIYAVETIVYLYAIKKLGVVESAVIYMMAPGLMYLTSYVILKEKVRRGEIISSLLLTVLVIIAVVV